MTSPIEGNNPLTPTMLDALRDLLCADLPRLGNYFVAPDGAKHMAKTIGAIEKLSYCRVCHDVRGRQVARVNEGLRSIMDAQLGVAAAQRRAELAAEADELAERELA